MIKLLTLFVVTVIIITESYAQSTAPSIGWKKSFGGSKGDTCISIIQTVDGGYIATGVSWSNDIDVTGNHTKSGITSADVWVVRLGEAGNIQWQRSLGGSGEDYGVSIAQTNDGGYIVAGFSTSNDGDLTGNKGGEDCWIVKLSNGGSIEWQKNYGGSNLDEAASIEQTSDGGYIAGCWSRSKDGDVSGNHGQGDYWILKLSNTGNIEWQKSFGGSGDDVFPIVKQTSDGGYIIGGSSVSSNGDVTFNHGGGHPDCWVIKIDNKGNILWQRSLGGSEFEDTYSIQQTSDNGYILAGYSSSNNGDISGHHGTVSSTDAWVVKLNSIGNILWEKSLGGSNDEVASSIILTTDSGYIIASYSNSNDGDVSGNKGNDDYWIVKLNNTGVIEWQKSYGGTGFDDAYSIQKTRDGGYVVAGFSESNDGDVNDNKGGGDFWILKLGKETTLPVTLVAFTGELKERTIVLKWSTSAETNSQGFQVERSDDGINFKGIENIQAKMNSSNTADYSYQDETSGQSFGIAYYRIRMIEKDGSSTYSRVISFNIAPQAVFRVTPNPAKNFITINGADLKTIQLFDISGKLVSSKIIPASGDKTLNISRLARGTYFVTTTNRKRQTQTKKIIIE